MTDLKKIFILILVVCGIFVWQMRSLIYQRVPVSETTIFIEKGNGSYTVAQKLAQSELIKSPLLFRLAARMFGLDKSLKAGEYEFSGRVSIYDIIQKIAAGDVLQHRITLPEGLTTAQMLTIINNSPLLSGEITIPVKEGELLPETYQFVKGDTKDSIVYQAKNAMKTLLERTWNERAQNLPLKTPHQLLILASIVEKETGLPEERGLVASVFTNRLIKGMKLQTDPTVIYALTLGKSDLGRLLTRKDLAFNSPYNTYVYYGLPPEPICNPGKDALQAAAQPEISDYLYFVAKGNGGHNFSATLSQHNQNVQNWKKSKKAE